MAAGNLEVHPPDDLPLVKEFTSCDVGFLRSAWFDPMALFVGAKGGNNQANHAHLDLGSFIFDAGGVRWAMDFGSDRYSLPGYFKDRRYTYYRTRTEAHNTVLFDNENQDLHGRASMKRSNDSLEIHLAAAHSRKLKAWIRRLQLVASHSLIIEDNIEALYPVEALWGMITPADIALHGKHAILKKNGKTLTAQIESPEDARFDIVSTRQPKPQNPNAGTAKLVVRLAANITAVKIRVRLTLA